MTIIVLGCGGNRSSNVIMSPDFVPREMINAELAVIVLDKDPQVIYMGNVLKAVEGSEALRTIHAGASHIVIIWRHFVNRLTAMMLRELDITEAFFAEVVTNYRITKEVVRTLDEVVTVEIPDLNTHFTVSGGGTNTTEPALVLFIDHIRIGTETNRYFAERAELGVATTTGRKLVCLLSFTLWNNRERKLISYGRVKATVNITREEATLENWDELFTDVVRQIFRNTGFLKRRR